MRPVGDSGYLLIEYDESYPRAPEHWITDHSQHAGEDQALFV